MDILKTHEIFEIDTLDGLKSAGLVEPLVFGGGTMLRLCYELNRYSVDIDFWFIKKVDAKSYFDRMRRYLEMNFDLTDAQIKFYMLLFEIRSKDYPKRLKIEIRKEARQCDFQEKIAFSKFSTKQVILRVHTLEQTMKNKVEAALERKEIRDFFDIEFMLRRGIKMTLSGKKREELSKVAVSFKDNDFKVTLGSIIDADTRRFYIANKFSYLLSSLRG
ncbi:MAG: nucleotidyl transferase AbiEii/AbiGii toxin family protein [Candidatus Omnitrophica bacterium]|nr:nucleotidyl transferase AbiEii/AbiGii toxin family protein [Candidatus Omnitrophota bacterium]